MSDPDRILLRRSVFRLDHIREIHVIGKRAWFYRVLCKLRTRNLRSLLCQIRAIRNLNGNGVILLVDFSFGIADLIVKDFAFRRQLRRDGHRILGCNAAKAVILDADFPNGAEIIRFSSFKGLPFAVFFDLDIFSHMRNRRHQRFPIRTKRHIQRDGADLSGLFWIYNRTLALLLVLFIIDAERRYIVERLLAELEFNRPFLTEVRVSIAIRILLPVIEKTGYRAIRRHLVLHNGAAGTAADQLRVGIPVRCDRRGQTGHLVAEWDIDRYFSVFCIDSRLGAAKLKGRDLRSIDPAGLHIVVDSIHNGAEILLCLHQVVAAALNSV